MHSFSQYFSRFLFPSILVLITGISLNNCASFQAFQTAGNGSPEEIKALISDGFDLQEVDWRGWNLFMEAAAHNNNPKKHGSIGPELYGVPIEVLMQKIVSGKYPENYIPKRKSKIMPLMPHLTKKISNLHAFINSS